MRIRCVNLEQEQDFRRALIPQIRFNVSLLFFFSPPIIIWKSNNLWFSALRRKEDMKMNRRKEPEIQKRAKKMVRPIYCEGFPSCALLHVERTSKIWGVRMKTRSRKTNMEQNVLYKLEWRQIIFSLYDCIVINLNVCAKHYCNVYLTTVSKYFSVFKDHWTGGDVIHRVGIFPAAESLFIWDSE